MLFYSLLSGFHTAEFSCTGMNYNSLKALRFRYTQVDEDMTATCEVKMHHQNLPCGVCDGVACKTGCVCRCIASTGNGVPQQADPRSDVHVHLTGAQESFT